MITSDTPNYTAVIRVSASSYPEITYEKEAPPHEGTGSAGASAPRGRVRAHGPRHARAHGTIRSERGDSGTLAARPGHRSVRLHGRAQDRGHEAVRGVPAPPAGAD